MKLCIRLRFTKQAGECSWKVGPCLASEATLGVLSGAQFDLAFAWQLEEECIQRWAVQLCRWQAQLQGPAPSALWRKGYFKYHSHLRLLSLPELILSLMIKLGVGPWQSCQFCLFVLSALLPAGILPFFSVLYCIFKNSKLIIEQLNCTKTEVFVLFAFESVFWIPSWPQTPYVAQDALEHLIFLPLFWSAASMNHHIRFVWGWGWNPGHCKPANNSTNCTTCLPPNQTLYKMEGQQYIPVNKE